MNERYGQGQAQPLNYASTTTSAAVTTFFNGVYAWMAAGLALTGVVAVMVANNTSALQAIFRPGVLIGLFVAELALVWVISAATQRINAGMATMLFLLYSALNGLTLSIIFLVYSKASIGGTFLVTAGMFGSISLYGYFTKRDLSRLGSFLFMALIGFVLASVVNIFWANSTLYWLLTYAGVLIFVGLTAWDTQKLKLIAVQTAGDPALAARLAVNGALMLYLDFINLFLLLLRILGKSRD
jgi:FtsH-binding integral membrane protein